MHVAAAGSLLELKLHEKSFEIPVGRVEYRYLFPMDFDEFVDALGYNRTYEYLRNLAVDEQISSIAHETFLEQYKEFSLVGGLPEVVASYVLHKKYVELMPIYSSLMASFVDDVYKYSTTAGSESLSFLLANAPKYSGSAIIYNKFAGSKYSSRQMSQAFSKLEKALLVNLLRPTKNVDTPVEANYKAAPKLIFLDNGLVNFASGAPANLDAHVGHMYKGRIAEQRVGASLWRQTKQADIPLHYWSRLKKGSSAEIDFLLSIEDKVVPVEVKSAATGRLRSLHQFMEQSDMDLAVKVSASNYHSEQVETSNGKKYTLVNIPHYLSFRLIDLVKDLLR